MSYTGDIDPSTLIPPPTQVSDVNQHRSIPAVVIALGVFTSLVVLSRLVSRRRLRNLGADDYAVIPALVRAAQVLFIRAFLTQYGRAQLCYIAWTAIAAWYMLHSGIGKPIGDVTYGEFIRFYQGIFVAAWVYPIMSASIRVSILLFYRRIFAKGNRLYTMSINALLLLQAAYVIVFEITPGFSCRPIADAWEPVKRLTSCTDWYIDQTIALYSVSLAFDIILLVFPIYAVSKLKMSLRKRCGVGFIFILGSGSGIAAAYKLAIFANESIDFVPTDPNWFKYQAAMYMPPQYNTYGTIFWIPTQVEPTVALIGTSLPAWIQITSIAHLQFSRLWSAIQSYRRNSGSRNNHESSRDGLRHRGIPRNRDSYNQMQDSQLELRPIPSGKGPTLNIASPRAQDTV